MRVLSAPGTRCPMESKPRQYIDDKTPVVVPDSIYYSRLVADGSLIPASAPAAKQKDVKREA